MAPRIVLLFWFQKLMIFSPKLKSLEKLQNEQRLQLSCVEILSSDAFLLILLDFYSLLRLNFWLELKKISDYKPVVFWRAHNAELGHWEVEECVSAVTDAVRSQQCRFALSFHQKWLKSVRPC